MVKAVDLSSIGISTDGLGYILEMLEENISITDVVSQKLMLNH